MAMQQTAEIQVPEGYQKVGEWLIPDQWSVRTLDGFIWYLEAGVSVNSVAEHEASTSEKLVLKTSCITHGKFDATEAKPIAGFDLKRAKCNPRKGSIIVSRMNTPDLVGEIGYVPMDMPSHFLPDRLWQAVFKPGDTENSLWLSYALSFTPISKRIKESATGTSGSMKNISKAAFLSTAVPTPLPQEQTAIANALSDVDALIAEQEKLIAKKQAIKTAAMQQLLTGKTRLPQFAHHPDGSVKGYKASELGEVPEDWEVLPFSDVAAPSPVRINPKVMGGGDFCVELEHIAQGGGRLTGFTETRSESSLKSVFEPGDVLFGKLRSYLRKYWIANRSGVCSTEIWVLRSKLKQSIPDFVFYLVQTDSFIEAASEAYGTHMPRADWNVIREQPVIAPCTEEQSAIATILTDMDNGIEALQQRLSKTRQIKQGMMQELLTGKTRLPFTDNKAAG